MNIRNFLRAGFAPWDKQNGGNYIVIRHSPDWLSFDLEASRAFCISVGAPETLIIGFVAVWDAMVGLDYRRSRYAPAHSRSHQL
jgi:hypothetical protein